MKLRMLILLICLFPITLLQAKEKKIAFGKIDKADLEMSVYEKDSSAVAVVLYDNGMSEIAYTQGMGWKLIFKRHKRIKILKPEGVDYGDFSIGLFRNKDDHEDLSSVKAVTFNLENGKVVKTELKRKDIHSEEVNENWVKESFSLPQVKAGSVIDVKYSVDSKGFFRNIQPWRFQYDIPVKYSEYTVRIPEYFHFRKFVRGHERFASFEEKSSAGNITLSSVSRNITGSKSQHSYDNVRFMNNNYHWIAKDMPAFKDEAYISSVSNYIQQVDFELQSVQFPHGKLHNYSQSWTSINRKLTEDAGFGQRIFGRHGFVAEKVAELTAGLTDELAKMQAIYNYVCNNFKYNGIQSIYPKEARKTWKEMNGNAADINLLLGAMLNEAGFDVKPVALSTRSHGLFLFPTVTGFNYVVMQCACSKGKVLLDATESYYGFNQLPYKCYNGMGLVVGGKEPEWIDLLSLGNSALKYTAQLNLSEEGTFSGTMRATRVGQSALGLRSRVNDFKTIDEYTEDYASKKANWSIEEHSLKNLENSNKPLSETLQLEISDKAIAGGDRIYFSPIIFTFEEENPFKTNERKYPVDFGYKLSESEMTVYNLPEGYEIEQLPEPGAVTLPGKKAFFRYAVQKIGENKLQVVCTMSINQSVFKSEEYQDLKEFFNNIIAKHSEQVILKKI